MNKLNELKKKVEKLNVLTEDDYSQRRIKDDATQRKIKMFTDSLRVKSKEKQILFLYFNVRVVSRLTMEEAIVVAKNLGISTLPNFDKIAKNLISAGLSPNRVSSPEAIKAGLKGIVI